MLRILGGVIGAVVLLFVAAVVGVNLYLQSDGVNERIQNALNDALGVEASISRCGYSPWGGVTLQGIKLQNQAGAEASIHKIRLQCESLPLFERRLVIKKISILEPDVKFQPIIAGNKPAEVDTSDPVDSHGHAEDPATQRPPQQHDETAAPATADEGKVPARQDWKVEVERIAIDGGSLTFLTDSGDRLVYCENLAVRTEFENATTSSGTITIARAIYRDAIQLREISSPYLQTNDSLELSDISADLEGGQVNGTIELNLASEPIVYAASIAVAGANVVEMMDFSGLPRDRLTGTLNGQIQLTGELDNWTSANGQANLEIVDGSMSQIEILQTLGQALQIAELVKFDINKAHAEATIDNGVTRVNELLIRSSNMRVTADGKITPDGKLDLDARLHLHAKIRKRLPDFAKKNMQDSAEDGYKYLKFKVDGTLAKPKTNVIERLIGDGLENKMKNFLNNLFGD